MLLILGSVACGDSVRKFSGFIQMEMEYLLASTEFKDWERISVFEDGQEKEFDDCNTGHKIRFYQGTVGEEKDLHYFYNPAMCDSIDFCNEYPDFCEAHKNICEEDPDACSELADGELIIGTWYALEPFVENTRSDTLIFNINSSEESIHVTNITSKFATFLYKNREAAGGGTIIENYQSIEETDE